MNPPWIPNLSSNTLKLVLAIRISLTLNVIAILLDIPIIRPLLGLLSLFVIPGLLIILILELKCANIWEYLLLCLGLSLSYIMLVGLILNQFFHEIYFPNPLAEIPVIVVLLISYLIGTELVLRKKINNFEVQSALSLTFPGWFFILLSTSLPIISTYGAINLNNGSGNIIAISLVLLISTNVLMILFFYSILPNYILPYSILMIGLSLLVSASLRSWHISGWDINQEFYVFQLTKYNYHWQFGSLRDPYNSCLSISILPTIINNYLGINDEYIFKFIYQLIFAFVPLVIYLVSKKFVYSFFGYLASMLFIFQPWFIQPMPALARQQIALLFFGLFLWIKFQDNFSQRITNILLVVFGVSMIVSHYSTAYIALGIFTIAFITIIILRKVLPTKRVLYRTNIISGWVLLLLIGFTFFWTNIQTQTSGNVPYVIQTTLNNLKNIMLGDLRSEDVLLSLNLTSERFDIYDIIGYVNNQSLLYSNHSGLYPPTTYEDYVPRVMMSAELDGIIRNELVRSLSGIILSFIRQLTKILLILGSLILLRQLLKRRIIDFEYNILNLIGLVILFLFIVLPTLSLFYNLFRIYVQILIISSASFIIGAFYLLFFVKKAHMRLRVIGVLLIVFFLTTNGVTSYIFGGPATMNLNNFGEEYDKFYTHEHEITSAKWLSLKREPNVSIYADLTASLRLISFGNGIFNVEQAVLPSTFTEESYVYLDYANLRVGIANAKYEGKQISYNYPIEFLNKNKNLIYDNGGSRIYK